jgi:hypothetical protein
VTKFCWKIEENGNFMKKILNGDGTGVVLGFFARNYEGTESL